MKSGEVVYGRVLVAGCHLQCGVEVRFVAQRGEWEPRRGDMFCSCASSVQWAGMTDRKGKDELEN